MHPALKFAITSAIIVIVSEIAKRSTFFGALLVSLPMMSILAVCWLYYDTGDTERIAALTASIFWLVIPSLVFFIVLPPMLRNGVAFGWSMTAAIASTMAAYLVTVKVLERIGISL